jgi:hypothetical protein
MHKQLRSESTTKPHYQQHSRNITEHVTNLHPSPCPNENCRGQAGWGPPSGWASGAGATGQFFPDFVDGGSPGSGVGDERAPGGGGEGQLGACGVLGVPYVDAFREGGDLYAVVAL